MAYSSDKKAVDMVKEDESLQDLAKKLPEGDALPDGFSEGFTEEESGGHSKDGASQKENQVQDSCLVASEGAADAEILRVNLETLSEKLPDFASTSSCGAESVKFSSSSTDASVAAEPNDASPCSSPSGRKHDKKEKLRRFPVPLSDKDSSDSNEEDIVGGLHTISSSGVDVSNSEVKQSSILSSSCFVDESAEEKKTRTTNQEKQDSVIVMASEVEPVQLMGWQDEHKDTCFQTEVVQLHTTLLEDELLDLRKQNKALMNEKKSTMEELKKNALVRDKLESLCRELQRQNKQLTDECKQIASEEQQMRLDLSTRFHDAIKDLTAKLEEQGDERMRQFKENELLQEKLKSFTQQYEFRDQQYAQQLRTKSLEQQLLEVKLKQQEELTKQGEAKIQVYTEQITQLLKTEQDLRGRLALYGDKFEQFQDTLTKSNEVFASFKSQMEKMSKNIKKLEKENLALKKKSEKSDVSLIELVDERANLKKQLETTRNQKEKLEALCRSLQAERKQQYLAMGSVAATAAATGAVSVAAALKPDRISEVGADHPNHGESGYCSRVEILPGNGSVDAL